MRGAVLAVLAAGLLPALGGCARPPDRDEVAACASAADGLAEPLRLRVAAAVTLAPDGEGRPGVRLALASDDAGFALPWLACRFARAGAPAEPVGLLTPRGPVDETHLVLLRRFWLGGEAAAEAAVAREGAEPLPRLGPRAAYLLQQGLNALPNAGVYGLLAAAYSMVYGLYGRINLAFGEIAAVGGLAAVAAAALARGTPPVALAAAVGLAGLWASALHGAAAERLVLWRLRRATGQQALVATLGVALVLREYLRLATGARARWLPPVLSDPFRVARAGRFVVTVTPMALLLAAGAAALAAALLAAFRWSAFGREWRAAADDPLAASLMGVDPRALSLRTTVVASALAGLAGAGLALHRGGAGFDETAGLGLRALAAAVLGGIGSVPGALLGGVGLALAEAAWSSYGPVEHRDLAIDALLVAALVLRPGGLLGAREPHARRMP